MIKLECRELFLEDIKDDNMLDEFERYEEVNKAWRTENNARVIKNIHYIEHWDIDELRSVCNGLKKTIINNGSVFAVFDNNLIVGFASLENNPFGSRKQYLQLSMLHVTKAYRHKGIGKALFEKCIYRAKELGAEKLYISASSSENAQLFYIGMGCIKACEINKRLAELEPYDYQMEYLL